MTCNLCGRPLGSPKEFDRGFCSTHDVSELRFEEIRYDNSRSWIYVDGHGLVDPKQLEYPRPAA